MSTEPPPAAQQRTPSANSLARHARAEVLYRLWDQHGWPEDRPAFLLAAWVEDEISRLQALPFPGQQSLFDSA